MDPSQAVHDAAREVLAAPVSGLTESVDKFIAKFLGWPFMVSAGFVVDRETRTESFPCVVHTTPARTEGPDAGGLPADGVAAVIDVTADLDLANLRAAYDRIVQAKRLKKTPVPVIKGAATTTVTLGIVLAQKSAVALEILGDELDRLNAATPGKERPDMVVVANTGVINYAVQFPGEGVSGDFLPPAEGALDAYTPATYVVMVMRPSGEYSLNKMLAFLILHLEIFSPGAKVPPWNEVLNGVSPMAVTLWGYQYNLRGELVRVPREFYSDRYMAPLPVRIEDERGDLLATVRFLPWQDGAAISLDGKLPLQGLLGFLGPTALKRGGVMQLEERQLSYVLPITDADFRQMLTRIQRQSNMVVRPVQPDWTLQKVADEGSSSPFMARLMIGMLRLRDTVSEALDRERFDEPYDFVIKSLVSSRDAMRQLTKVWEDHERKVGEGEVAHVRGNALQIDESVDRELGQEADAFLNAASRVLKKGMQDVARVLGVNIGFLFQKEGAFETGVNALQSSDPALADYLRQARTWSEAVQRARNAVEHEGWTLPRVKYARASDKIKAIEPEIMGKPATEFVAFTFDRLACFVEEVTAHLLKLKLGTLTTLTEVPLVERPAEIPERFRLTLTHGGMSAWVIVYHSSSFEHT